MQALADGMGIDRGYRFKSEGPGCYLFVHRPAIGEENEGADESDEPDLFFKYVSAQPVDGEDAPSDDADEYVELERTWYTYRSAKEGIEVLGTLVIMPGMFGTPQPVIESLERYMRNRGWCVLRMLSHPSRFTQRQQYFVPEGSEDSVAQKIAKMFDTRTAEAAYSASSALRFVHDQVPEHKDKPVVLMGMSGGAMILPTVYSYDPGAYDAGILIAGGGNFLEINTRSNYAKWIDAIDLDAEPSEDSIEALSETSIRSLVKAYLEASKLDSLHTASSMSSTPMLMIHGNRDKAVPASTGDALHRALGSPERWVYPVGHELIFGGLVLQVPKIERWMRQQILELEADL